MLANYFFLYHIACNNFFPFDFMNLAMIAGGSIVVLNKIHKNKNYRVALFSLCVNVM